MKDRLSHSTDTLLIRSISANNLSPIELYQKVGWNKPSFLLDGSSGGWFDGRFSLMGSTPFGIFQSKERLSHFDCLIAEKQGRVTTCGDPLVALQAWLDRFRPPSPTEEPQIELSFTFGGVVGFFSYELTHQLEKIPFTEEKSDFPDIYLLFLNFYALIDHLKDVVHLIYNPIPEIRMGRKLKEVFEEGHEKINATEKKLTHPLTSHHSGSSASSPDKGFGPGGTTFTDAASDCSPESYIDMVHCAQAYIAEGDIFQANLSHEFTAPFLFDSLFSVYQRLWQINPSPFSCYLDLGEIQIASGSPERLVRIKKPLKGAVVETRPIAGTRPRGANPDQDKALIASLYVSEKEQAEHLMLIDLERNDLGKICRYGSVSVDSMMTLEKYSHVVHLVSNISGILLPEISPLQVLKALFPGGTITGVPKIRCMEIIAALERKARGIYTGSIGYIGFDGEMDLNIAIRTWIRKKEQMMFRVGAGIVADSDPQSEYQETLQKAAALMQAIRPDLKKNSVILNNL